MFILFEIKNKMNSLRMGMEEFFPFRTDFYHLEQTFFCLEQTFFILKRLFSESFFFSTETLEEIVKN